MIQTGFNYSLRTTQLWKTELQGKILSAYLKSMLSITQKQARIVFIEAQKEPGGELFQSCRNKVHLDETWYYLTENA
jgi:hypothetical protein